MRRGASFVRDASIPGSLTDSVSNGSPDALTCWSRPVDSRHLDPPPALTSLTTELNGGDPDPMKRTMIQTLLGNAYGAFAGDVRLDLGARTQSGAPIPPSGPVVRPRTGAAHGGKHAP